MLSNVSNREIRMKIVPTDEVPRCPYYWEIVAYYTEIDAWHIESYGWSETLDIAFSDAKIEINRLNEKYPIIINGRDLRDLQEGEYE